MTSQDGLYFRAEHRKLQAEHLILKAKYASVMAKYDAHHIIVLEQAERIADSACCLDTLVRAAVDDGILEVRDNLFWSAGTLHALCEEDAA